MTFRVRNADQETLAMWARAMRAHTAKVPTSWTTSSSLWTERPFLVHSPEQTIGYPISDLYPAGTYVKDIKLDPQTKYHFRGEDIYGDELTEMVGQLKFAVRVYLNVDNQRHYAGHVPHDLALDIYDRLYTSDTGPVVYIYKATLLEMENRLGLEIQLRETGRSR